ncbi:MAG: VanZ family protein [Candidatus Omnitrophica bacterium]|nr:VanZ family protein [Candidatus Omnitrophota bacterium]
MRKSTSQKLYDGALAIGYVLLLWGSAPFVPALWSLLERRFSWSPFLPYLISSLLVLLCWGYLPRRFFRILSFLMLAGIFLVSMSCLKRPVERIHFIEYGLLSFFLFRFLRHSVKVPWSYGLTLVGTFLIGVVDEILQGFLPNRVFDLRDIWINAWAGGLGVVCLSIFLTPSSFPP